jgi:hypothetical protein
LAVLVFKAKLEFKEIPESKVKPVYKDRQASKEFRG